MLLEIGREGEPGKPHEWTGERALVIGRGRNAEMMLADPLLSRRHCQLEMSAGVVVVHDLGSANGTFVNGIQTSRAAITPGDVVTLGRSWLRIVPEMAQVRIGQGDDGPSMTQRFDKRAVSTAPERRYEGAADGSEYPEIDGYELFGTIGKGSFGTVYRAKNRASGRLAAIKVIPTGANAKAENVARFLREIEATGQLAHPHLVNVYGAGEGPHFAYLIMEYVDGDTLARTIQREERIPPPRALEIGRQIASALEHAFSRGFVHRDVKPENILIDSQGTAKLCDFGLVKNLAASSGANLTRPGQGFGSLAYMPPEQVREAAKADQRADVYSLGATLYNALTGRRPFSGPVNKGFLRRVIEEAPEPVDAIVPSVPPDVVQIVDRCMRKDPAQRFQSPRELRHALEAAIRGASTGLERALVDPARAQPAALGAQAAPAPTAPSGGTVGGSTANVPALPSQPVAAASALAPRPPAPAAPQGSSSSARLSAPTPVINSTTGRAYSTSDSDAFDDFAKDLGPISTDSSPGMKLPLPGAAIGPEALPPHAPAPVPAPAHMPVPALAPAVAAATPHAAAPAPAPRAEPFFPHGDETRRTPTPPFLAIGRTGTPVRIEPPSRDTLIVEPPLVALPVALPTPALGPDGRPLPETLKVPPPAHLLPVTVPRRAAPEAAAGTPPPAGDPAAEGAAKPAEGLLGMISRRFFKQKGAKPGGAGGAPS